MENLKGITEAKVIDNQVYVVENEMVFSYLTSSEKKKVWGLQSWNSLCIRF